MRVPPALMIFAIALLGCGDLGNVLSLQRGLAHAFGTEAISVNVNNGTDLTIVFANSDSAALAAPARAAFARRVADYARDHFKGYATLQRIHVGFSQVRQTGIVTMTHSDVPYTFTTTELGLPEDTTANGITGKAAA